MKHTRVSFVSIILLLLLAVPSVALAAGEGPLAPVLGQDAPRVLHGRYAVVFKDGAGPGATDAAMRGLEGTVLYRYHAALHGFAAELPDQAVEALRHNPNVDYIEADQVITLDATQSPATWGLDRIDQRALPLNNTYTYDSTGAGVTAYIIDTGILLSHTEFGGRASFGYDALGGNGIDCNGHGTHVAGTVGGATYGVAKGVTLVAVRVLDCGGSGTNTGVIAGIDWVTAQHQPGTPAVANMSLGGSASTTLDNAVKGSIADGVSYAVAAGNGNIFGIAANACNYSPARVPEAMTIGATNSSDTKASWSNYGDCVDWFAPGVNITSAWYTSTSATNTISGTSMATPHTTGVAALYLQANPSASPVAVREALYEATTKGIVTSSRTTNNHLLYSLVTAPPANVPPSASFTYTCTDLGCTFTDASTDSDGTITGWSWAFGDGATSTAQNLTHTYAAAGTYAVQLTVTDNLGATGSTSEPVTVTAPPTPVITLSAGNPRIVKGTGYVDLAWSGATGASVDVYRTGVKVRTVSNTGAYTDKISKVKPPVTYTYKVCQAGTQTCSNEATVTFQ